MDIVDNKVKVFGKKSPYFITQIQNVKVGEDFRYNKEFCKLNPLNPYWFFCRNKEGVTELERIVDNFDKWVAIPMKKVKK